MNEFLKSSETHPGNRCNCKLHIRDKRKYQNVCLAKKKKKKKKKKIQIFDLSVIVFVGWYFSVEIVLSLPVGHFFNEEGISKTREKLLTNEGKQGYE